MGRVDLLAIWKEDGDGFGSETSVAKRAVWAQEMSGAAGVGYEGYLWGYSGKRKGRGGDY